MHKYECLVRHINIFECHINIWDIIVCCTYDSLGCHTHTHVNVLDVTLTHIEYHARLLEVMLLSHVIHTHMSGTSHDSLRCHAYTHMDVLDATHTERWGAGVKTQKMVRGEIGGWGRIPFNETYAPSLSTIYDGA